MTSHEYFGSNTVSSGPLESFGVVRAGSTADRWVSSMRVELTLKESEEGPTDGLSSEEADGIE